MLELYPSPLRMAKGHTHKLLGNWFKEHWDLRDIVNQDTSLDLEKTRAVALELRRRILACGRDHPVPRITLRAQARLNAEARLAEAVAEQQREADHLQNLPDPADASTMSLDEGGGEVVQQGEKCSATQAPATPEALKEDLPDGVGITEEMPHKKMKLDVN
mmetsp:Transcript_3733/g.4995  ORF Transcript_3733/g.4995 Transcript_3733/m.4995 type:complete len:161 (-) Transcript_3733:188-670(-)